MEVAQARETLNASTSLGSPGAEHHLARDVQPVERGHDLSKDAEGDLGGAISARSMSSFTTVMARSTVRMLRSPVPCLVKGVRSPVTMATRSFDMREGYLNPSQASQSPIRLQTKGQKPPRRQGRQSKNITQNPWRSGALAVLFS